MNPETRFHSVILQERKSLSIFIRKTTRRDVPVLLSDPEREAIEAYDVWKEKKMYGKTSMGVVRTTYIINEEGIIEKVFEKAKPDTNAAEILEYLAQA